MVGASIIKVAFRLGDAGKWKRGDLTYLVLSNIA